MYDLIIIGAGPAGLTAGLYAGRYRLKTLILEKINIGGQIIRSSTIENFPGFPGAVSTQELIDRLKKQVDDLGINIETEEVLKLAEDIKSEPPVYTVKTHDRSYKAKSVIIAAGAQPKQLGVEGESRLIGRGISYCGTCDGPFFKGKDIVVVGAGDRAMEEAIFLSGYANKVTVIHRRQDLRASKILEEKAREIPKINFILENVVEEIVGADRVEAVKIKDLKSGLKSTLPCHGVFIFVGVMPNTTFLNNQLNMDEKGFIITDENLETSKKGIFACGDCRKKSLYQVVTACSDGAVAASSVQKYLL